MIMQCIISLSIKPLINRTGYDFIQLDSYLKPGYDAVMNNTKIQFHNKLISSLRTTHLHQKIFLGSAIAIFTLLIIRLIWKMSIFYSENTEVFIALFTIREFYITKIKDRS